MNVATIGIAVAVVCLALVVFRLGRRGRGLGVDPLHVPTLNVVTIGMQGSGKTILLASMYRCMQTPGGRGFYLRAPHEQVIELGSWYHDVADPGEGWPAGTSKAETREFQFDLVTNTATTPATVLRLNYLEYAGELLTEVQDPGGSAQARLLTAVDGADALIGIIDGLRLRLARQGDGRSMAILQRAVDTMVSTMYEARCPITFVITKWDLLTDVHPDEDTRLRIVRTMLLESPGFRDLVRHHGARRVLRLIPVTAVGHDFALLDRDTVQKKPGGLLRPVNVDLPLSGVVPDVLLQLEMSLDQAIRQAFLDEARRRSSMRPLDAAAALGTFVAQAVGRTLSTTLSAGMLGLFVDAGLSLFLDRRPGGQGPDDTAAVVDSAEEFILARRRVIRSLHDQVSRLEATLPSSRLEIEV